MLDFNVAELSTESMRNTMTLVRFSAHEWGNQKHSLEATRAAKLATKAVGDVGAFRKKLLASHDMELRAVRKVLRAARESHYSLTRPYANGVATIANVHMMDYLKLMAEHKKVLGVAKAELVAHLPSRIAAAMSQLGDMANASDYPDPKSIADKFSMEFEFTPLPSTDVAGAGTLPPGFADKMQQALELRIKSQMKAGFESGWKDVSEAVEHLVTTISNPETVRFRGSLIGNVASAVKLTAAWNLTANPQYDQLIGFIEKVILVHSAKDLREDPDKREAVISNGTKVYRLINKQLNVK